MHFEHTASVQTKIPRLGIGTAALAVPYGAPGGERRSPDPEEARRTLLAALDRGVGLIDTAPTYGDAESIVARALAGRDDDCFVATKVAPPPAGWDALAPAEVRRHVRASAEASLRALGRGRLDLLQVHNADQALVRAGVVGEALVELRDAGLVGMTGGTVYGEANALAVISSAAFESVQVAYSALDRRPERRVLPAASAAGKAVIARSLLLRGVLSVAGRELDGPFAQLASAADGVRTALGASWDELPGAAVAFVRGRPGVACALLGPRDEAELTALLDLSELFAGRATGIEPPPASLPEWLLDPSRWAQEAGIAP